MEAVKEQEGGDSDSEDYSDSESDDGDEEEEHEQVMDNETQSSSTKEVTSVETPSFPSTHSPPFTITGENSEPSLVGTLEKLKLEDPNVSDLSDTQLSRSPPQSRRGEDLPEESGDEHTDGELPAGNRGDVKAIVSSDITKMRAQQQRKYHSKRSTRNAGRAQGSKAKQDNRVRLSEHGGFWG